MADGLTRLLAPILSFTADELWRHLPGRARGVGAHGAVPDRGRASTRSPIRRWSSAGTRWSALRERVLARDRAAAQEQADRQLAAGEGRHLRDRPAELPLLEQYAQQLPMLFIVSEVELRPAPTDAAAERSRAAHRHRARRRREVRALLAHRAGGLERAGVGRSLRPVPGRAGRDRPWITRIDEAIAADAAMTRRRRRAAAADRVLAADGDRRRRSGDQGDGPRLGAAPRQRHRHPGLLRHHARAEQRRGVRHPQRRRLSVQDA